MALPNPSENAAAKANLRKRATARRRAVARSHGLAAAEAVADKFLSVLGTQLAGKTVGGYWPMGDELDPRPLLAALDNPLALPVVVADALQFRAWTLGDPLESGAHGTRHPAAGKNVVPDVVIAPLVAFDRRGHRLGRGGGFYDRAIARLRAHGLPLVVGVAFDAQEVDAIPVEPSDQHLDWIVTETRAIKTP